MRTAIGSASFARQLAVHGTREQHLADGVLPSRLDTRLIMCCPDAVIRHQLHRIERGCAGRSTSLSTDRRLESLTFSTPASLVSTQSTKAFAPPGLGPPLIMLTAPTS